MKKSILSIFTIAAFIWSCDASKEFEPAVQQVQLGQAFWVAQGESVYLSSEDLLLSNIILEGWNPRGFVGPVSTARINLGELAEANQISISHRLQCEYEFVGKAKHCTRDEAFFERLETLSSDYSNAAESAYQEVAQLDNGLKIYMLLVEADESSENELLVAVKRAEFLIRKD